MKCMITTSVKKHLLAFAALAMLMALGSCGRTPKPIPSVADPGSSAAAQNGSTSAQATGAAQNLGYELYFVNVGKGDCTLIGLPGGKWALVDAGPDSGVAAIHGLLTVLGVKQFEAIFISHPHNDHIGNLDNRSLF